MNRYISPQQEYQISDTLRDNVLKKDALTKMGEEHDFVYKFESMSITHTEQPLPFPIGTVLKRRYSHCPRIVMYAGLRHSLIYQHLLIVYVDNHNHDIGIFIEDPIDNEGIQLLEPVIRPIPISTLMRMFAALKIARSS